MLHNKHKYYLLTYIKIFFFNNCRFNIEYLRVELYNVQFNFILTLQYNYTWLQLLYLIYFS